MIYLCNQTGQAYQQRFSHISKFLYQVHFRHLNKNQIQLKILPDIYGFVNFPLRVRLPPPRGKPHIYIVIYLTAKAARPA